MFAPAVNSPLSVEVPHYGNWLHHAEPAPYTMVYLPAHAIISNVITISSHLRLSSTSSSLDSALCLPNCIPKAHMISSIEKNLRFLPTSMSNDLGLKSHTALLSHYRPMQNVM